MLTIISYFFFYCLIRTLPKQKQSRWLKEDEFQPLDQLWLQYLLLMIAAIHRLQHDNGAHVCSMTYPSTALGDSKSCCMAPVWNLVSPAHSSQTNCQTFLCLLASMITEVGCTNPFTRVQQWEWQGQAALWQFLLGHLKQSRTSLATRQNWANSSYVLKWWPRGVRLQLTNLSPFSCCQLFQDSLSILDFCVGKCISQKSRIDRKLSPCLQSQTILPELDQES